MASSLKGAGLQSELNLYHLQDFDNLGIMTTSVGIST